MWIQANCIKALKNKKIIFSQSTFGKVSLMARQNYQAGVRTTAGSLSSVIAPCK